MRPVVVGWGEKRFQNGSHSSTHVIEFLCRLWLSRIKRFLRAQPPGRPLPGLHLPLVYCSRFIAIAPFSSLLGELLARAYACLPLAAELYR